MSPTGGESLHFVCWCFVFQREALVCVYLFDNAEYDIIVPRVSIKKKNLLRKTKPEKIKHSCYTSESTDDTEQQLNQH